MKNKLKLKKLCIIVPVFNESDILKKNIQKLINLLISLKNKLISQQSFIGIIDDGSDTYTKKILIRLKHEFKENLKIIHIHKNTGQQNALQKGYTLFDYDIAISIDIDLQDSFNTIIEMIKSSYKGKDIVITKRKIRIDENFLRLFIKYYYYYISRLINPYTIFNSGDFRLITKNKWNKILNNHSHIGYLRGIIHSNHKDTALIYTTKKKRIKKKRKNSGYNFIKLFKLAISGLICRKNSIIKIIVFNLLVFSQQKLRIAAFSSLMALLMSYLYTKKIYTRLNQIKYTIN